MQANNKVKKATNSRGKRITNAVGFSDTFSKNVLVLIIVKFVKGKIYEKGRKGR